MNSMLRNELNCWHLSAYLFLQSFPATSVKLGPGTRVVDVEMLDEDNNILEISNLSEEEEPEIVIPKTAGGDGNNTLPGEM